jgi:hypothetical protein
MSHYVLSLLSGSIEVSVGTASTVSDQLTSQRLDIIDRKVVDMEHHQQLAGRN